MNICIEKKAGRDGGGYHVFSKKCDSEALLADGLENTIEIKWFTVDEKLRGKGIGEFIVKEIYSHFSDKTIVPADILTEAEGFWEKMEAKGFCKIKKSYTDKKIAN